MKNVALIILVFLTSHLAQAQSLNLWDCWRLARENYPMSRQRQLIALSSEYTIANAARGYLPKLSFSGQATIQSDVTSLPAKIPIAGFSFPDYSKDQYKIYGQIDQVVYDGGMIDLQKQEARVNRSIQEQSLDVELHTVFDRVDQLYFGILLLDGQLKQIMLTKDNIQLGIDQVKARIDNGLAYKGAADELLAQLLEAEQTRIDLTATRLGYFSMLALFIGQKLDPLTALEEPAEPALTTTIDRPELRLFDYQKRSFDIQDELANAQLRPKLGIFLQGGYGRPGLNMLSNNFSTWYLAGARFTWALDGLYTIKRQHRLAALGRRTLDLQKQTFLLNTKLQQHQYGFQIAGYYKLTTTDDTIVDLRTSVRKTALAQLQNGVLSGHDYLIQVNAEDQARQKQWLHHIQYLQTAYNYQTLVGH